MFIRPYLSFIVLRLNPQGVYITTHVHIPLHVHKPKFMLVFLPRARVARLLERRPAYGVDLLPIVVTLCCLLNVA